ncbi:MAG TPA: tRNA threonylcarbamoyladenosine dehydratase [Firmicutes bacterium]|nr:tRNA threonylcarbamoyladenosine dehydratase [Bacillota bacterium]
MRDSRFARELILIGERGLNRLLNSKVVLFGLGGVGSFAAEALARAGVGTLVLVDGDMVELTNFNRQLLATVENLATPKVEAMRKRLSSINPGLRIIATHAWVSPDNAQDFIPPGTDYVVDAVDDVKAKVAIIKSSRALGIPVVSSMGAGDRLDPTRFRVADISSTHTCPLARAVRHQLRQIGVLSGVKVVFSDEPPIRHPGGVPGSISFVPPVAGMVLASVVVRDLLSRESQEHAGVECGDGHARDSWERGGKGCGAGGL